MVYVFNTKLRVIKTYVPCYMFSKRENTQISNERGSVVLFFHIVQYLNTLVMDMLL